MQSGDKEANLKKESEAPNPEDLAWYERDLDDYDFDIVHDTEAPSDGEDDKQPLVFGHSGVSLRSSHRSACCGRDEGSVSYPLDVWFLLSEHIDPADVARFAAICSAAHYVVHTSRFWIHLYKRYYKSSITLPVELLPECTERNHGLKARVVRSLFYTHTPFTERSKSFEILSGDLEGLSCILMWHQGPVQATAGCYWNFFFKFKKVTKSRGCSLLKKSTGKLDLINGMDDIDYNPEDGCCVLQVKCPDFVSMPSVMGLVLSQARFGVAQVMHHHRIKLTFQSQQLHAQNSGSTADAATIILDPVLNAQVLYWWDKRYPRPG